MVCEDLIENSYTDERIRWEMKDEFVVMPQREVIW